MELLTIIAVIALLLPCTLAALTAWWLLRRTRRTAVHWQGRVQALRAGWMPPGPRRDVVRLRRRLHDELRSAHDVLTTSPNGKVFRADAAGLLAELTSTAAALDNDLRAVERFVDPAQQQAALAGLSPQVEQLIAASYSARQTVLRTAAEDRARQLSALSDCVDQEAAAAALYREGGRELSL
jgi:hypothetical protein